MDAIGRTNGVKYHTDAIGQSSEQRDWSKWLTLESKTEGTFTREHYYQDL